MKRRNKVLNSTLLGVVLLGGTSTPLLAGVEGNITLASHYIWRGIDRNNTNPAIQGGFDLNLENGLYSGIWASNVEGAQASNNVELDFYAGYTYDFNNFGLGFAYIRYEYPKATPDFEELMLQGSYKGLSLTYYQYLGSPDVGESENYLRVKAEINLPGAVGMTLAAGQSSIKGLDEVNDALIGFSKHAGGLKLGIAATTSNLDHVTKTKVETEFLTLSISKAM